MLNPAPQASVCRGLGRGRHIRREDSPAGGPGGKTPKGAVFKGLAIASTKAGPELFASDVHNGAVDIFNGKFASVPAPSEFKDPHLPAGYLPFGIQALGGKIYVSYGKQNAQKTGVVPGAGFGAVDVYSVNGLLLHHLVSDGPASPLNEPWAWPSPRPASARSAEGKSGPPGFPVMGAAS